MTVTMSVDVRGHFGAWRALAALPAAVGGAIVMLVLTAPLNAWQAPVLLLWLNGAVAFRTRDGERIALRAREFRHPSSQQWEVLGPVSSAALQRCGFQTSQVDWYVRAGSQPNACVAGRRSVAVTEPNESNRNLSGRFRLLSLGSAALPPAVWARVDACHTSAPASAVSDRVGAAVTLRGGTPWQSSSSTSSSSEEDRPVR